MKKNTGITLIALIITIIILLILAGVTLSLTLGENGLFNIAKKGVENYNLKSAEDKLTTVLLDLQSKKYNDPTYNETTYINNEIERNGMSIEGDVVTVGEYHFLIDKTVPKIISRLEDQTEDILILAEEIPNSDYTKSTIKITITSGKKINKVIIDGQEITVTKQADGTYIGEKEATQNGLYSIMAINEEGKYKISNINLMDMLGDIDIYTIEDLQRFRNKVNNGNTYEGYVVRLKNNLDLISICGQNVAANGTRTGDTWVPIGDGAQGASFKGLFDGENHTIDNIYVVNNDRGSQGLFGIVKKGGIKDTTVGGFVSGYAVCGGLCGQLLEDNIEITGCKNKATVKTTTTGCAGGICGNIGNGVNNIKIIDCENTGTIIAYTSMARRNGW